MEIKKSKLKEMYNSMCNEDLCKKLGITKPTLINLLNKAGIPLKGKGNRNNSTKIKLID